MSHPSFDGQTARSEFEDSGSAPRPPTSTANAVARELRPVPNVGTSMDAASELGSARADEVVNTLSSGDPASAAQFSQAPAGAAAGVSANAPASARGADRGDTRIDSGDGATSLSDIAERVQRLERANRMLRVLCLLIVAVGVAFSVQRYISPDTIVQRSLTESKELTLVDNDGNARLFLRMYSKVPVLQLMDGNGKPRMSLGLRFDDTPFIDLSDKRGRTRATFEMTEEDAPALRLFNEHGDITFAIN